MALLIRPATALDDDGLWRVLEPTIRAGETYALPRDLGRDEALAFWRSPGADVMVAVDDDGSIVGTYFLRPNQKGGGAHVANGGYATASDRSGRGVGHAMCLHSLEHARARGYHAVQFNFVVSSNTRAVALWQRCGFEIVGRLPGGFAHPTLGFVDAFVMFQTL